jgi:hypothetical protein
VGGRALVDLHLPAARRDGATDSLSEYLASMSGMSANVARPAERADEARGPRSSRGIAAPSRKRASGRTSQRQKASEQATSDGGRR